ncbi:MAG TPA: dTDP-4-dehydrorhamnose reductase [Campylobacterales bacterium]|nr:dTDP-4-dehydrorhamnose reductase [Campylobacterales bacterium]
MSNILLTGSSGQLGCELKDLSNSSHDNFFFTSHDNLDIGDFQKIKTYCQTNSIEVIINSAAYTAVDKAQSEKEEANKINYLAVKNLATISKELNIKLIHISTDYVFDGKNYKPYCEDDKTNPVNYYGESKLLGEEAIKEINPNNSIIIRTSWLYSSYGANFVKTMLKLGKTKESLGVIYEQVGTPTYAKDLANTILHILPKLKNNKVEIYHYSNEGVLSWYDFAKEIMKMTKLECQIDPIQTIDYPTPAARPCYSLLNKSKIKNDFNIKIPYWKDSLSECLTKLGERR